MQPGEGNWRFLVGWTTIHCFENSDRSVPNVLAKTMSFLYKVIG